MNPNIYSTKQKQIYLQNLISDVVANIVQFLSNYSPEATLEMIVVFYNKNNKNNNHNTRFDRKVLPPHLKRFLAQTGRLIKKLFIFVRGSFVCVCVCVCDVKLNLTVTIVLFIYLLLPKLIYVYLHTFRLLKYIFIRYFFPILLSSSHACKYMFMYLTLYVVIISLFIYISLEFFIL